MKNGLCWLFGHIPYTYANFDYEQEWSCKVCEKVLNMPEFHVLDGTFVQCFYQKIYEAIERVRVTRINEEIPF